MAQSSEALNTRLENINAIQPLLEALRTISLSNWRFSLRKIELAKSYISSLFEIYNGLELFDEDSGWENLINGNQKPLILAIGSNRGLCGNFNRDIAGKLQQIIKTDTEKYRVAIVGERLRKILDRKNFTIHQYIPLPNTTEITQKKINAIINQISSGSGTQNITLLFKTYRGAGRSQVILSPVFPNEFIKPAANKKSLDNFIFDTPKKEINSLLFENLFQLSAYYAFLLSSAAEHSTRFQLMENASKNADHLSDELFLEVQSLRRQKITEEMQELAVGAGLLNKRR